MPIHPANKIAITVSNKPADKPTAFLHSSSSIVLTNIILVDGVECSAIVAVISDSLGVDRISGLLLVWFIGAALDDRFIKQLTLMNSTSTLSH